MGIVNVALGERSYDIKIGTGLLHRLGVECARLGLGTRCAIISDTNAAPRFGTAALKALAKAGFVPTLITIPAGETAKSLKTVEACYNQLAALRLERKSFIVALGGGVVGIWPGSWPPPTCAACPSCRCPPPFWHRWTAPSAARSA